MKLTLMLAAAASLSIAGGVHAQAPAYGPGTFQYRLDTQVHAKQEMMGQTQEVNRNASQHITIKLDSQGGDVLGFAITVDSSTADSPEAQAQSAKLVGKTVTGTVSQLGKVLTFSAPTDSAIGDAEFRSLKQFFVRLPDKTARGASVVDTVSDTINTQGLKIEQLLVMTSTVAGDTTINGEKAIILERTGNISLSGDGEQGGQELVMDGTGTVSGKLYVGANGILSGQLDNNAQMTVSVPAANMTIPITQTATSKFERVSGK
jgi:hypothetical protein